MIRNTLLSGFILSAALFASACVGEDQGSTLANKASFELNCTKGSLRYTKLGRNQYGVAGCGKRATYVRVCKNSSGWSRECVWLRN